MKNAHNTEKTDKTNEPLSLPEKVIFDVTQGEMRHLQNAADERNLTVGAFVRLHMLNSLIEGKHHAIA
ncbi:hypothetical protein P3T73_12170 [Kiritimatiellota bacterium B12222]|nr:hypothetical protein P3T73_12170 [Kiritimatiellota bacterium B12222]